MPLDSQGERNAAATGADIGHETTFPVSRFPFPVFEHQIHEAFRLGPGDQGARVDRELQRPESDGANGVRKRDATRELSQRVFKS